METGDGQIVRIRPRCGWLAAADLIAISRLAQQYGNGLIDLTRRANIQMRGVRGESYLDLLSALDALGLTDDTVAEEAARNVMVNPLAGLDPTEAMDVRPIARALESELLRNAAACRMPGKFGFVVDGGGRLSLDDERADIRLRASGCVDGVKMAIGIDRPGGVRWLRLVSPDEAVTVAISLMLAFGALAAQDGDARMIELSDADVCVLERALEGVGQLAAEFKPVVARSDKLLGSIAFESGSMAVGLAAALGRVEARDLLAVTQEAIALGVSEFRLSPWRSFYLPVPNIEAVRHMLDVVNAHGFIVTADDPLVAIDACPGSPACASAHMDTRAAARVLAPILAELGCATAHVSGCSKGCARSKAADLVLIGEEGGFRVVRHGTVNGPTAGYLAPDNIQSLRSLSRSRVI
jgi:precorrin-3B synthase